VLDMRYTVILVTFLLLEGCASFDNIISQGMEKEKFSHTGVRNELTFEPIYYDSKSKIEVLIPTGLFNSTGQIVIFENVSHPYPVWWLKQSARIPKGYCEYSNCMTWGNGIVKSWYSEDDITMKALQGDTDAKLLVSAIQLYRDSDISLIEQIMSRESVSRKAAERKHFYNKVKLRENYRDNITNHFKAEMTGRRVAQSTYSNSYIRLDNTAPRANSNPSSELKYLMSLAIDLYVDKALGVTRNTSNISKVDLQKIENASKKGMRDALRKNKRMQQVYKNLSTPVPIR